MSGSYSNRIVVVDCGGDTCKIGFAGQARPLKIIPNVALRPKRETSYYMADQIEQLQDMSQLYYKRPHEKGYVTNWELENQILGRIFGKSMLDVRDKEATLLITEPLFNPAPLRKQMDESIFERHGFEAYHRIPAPSLALFGFQNEPGQNKFGQPCALVLDTGYSFTHAVPFFNNQPIFAAIKRLNVGGKVLTNYLKETISYRVWNMMDETHLMNDIKHRLCYVSTDFMSDMKELERHKKGKLAQSMTTEYVLPNGTTRFSGFVRTPETKLDPDDQTLTLCNERIAIPEILFHPSDIGLEQCGLAELIVSSINRCPKHMHSLLYQNILVVGGNACFTGFRQRLEKDVRQLAPSEYKVAVAISQDPILTAWQGGSRLATDQSFPSVCVTRQQYEEHGVGVCLRKFGQI